MDPYIYTWMQNYPDAYTEHRSDHPKSPHKPPMLDLSKEQMKQYKDEGYFIAKDIFTDEMKENL